MVSSKTKISLLVAGHILAGVLLTKDTHLREIADPPTVRFLSLFLAEAGLLGIWAALGTSRFSWWLSAVLGAITYLSLVLVAGPGRWNIVSFCKAACLFAGPATLGISLVLATLRISRHKLHMVQMTSSSADSEAFQFMLRYLFLTTTIAAIISALVRGIRQFTSYGELAFLFFLCTLVPCLIMVELALLWATLGIGRPGLRLLLVLPIAFLVGAMLPFCLKEMFEQDWKEYMAWSSIFGFQAIITASSLLVIRSCGWRLVRGDRNEIESLPTPLRS